MHGSTMFMPSREMLVSGHGHGTEDPMRSTSLVRKQSTRIHHPNPHDEVRRRLADLPVYKVRVLSINTTINADKNLFTGVGITPVQLFGHGKVSGCHYAT